MPKSELDLDALEREINAPGSTGMLWKDIGLALIERVRKAEAERDWATGQSKMAVPRWNQDRKKLERVREAAGELMQFPPYRKAGSHESTLPYSLAWNALREALADLKTK